jgi:tol-pal system protein YbgF
VRRQRLYSVLVSFFVGFLFLGGCVSHDTEYIRRDINTLQQQIDGLREDIRSTSTRAPAPEPATTMEARKEQADLRAEVENVKRDVTSLKALIEDNQDLTSQTSMRLDDQEKRFTGRLNEIEAKIDQLLVATEEGKPVASEPAASSRRAEEPEEPAVPEASGGTIQSEVDKAYQEAYDTFRAGDLDKARQKFLVFLEDYPDTPLSDNAQFWIGEIAYNKHQYEAAILAYENVIKKYPKSNKLPDAILKQGLAFLELGDKIDARIILENLVKKYPQTKQAEIAQNKLKTLK